jgi:DNA-binding Xre family transcriptional regulator
MRKKRASRVIRLKIKEIAESRNINMAKLSRMSDVAYNTIRGIWDNENRDISISILDRIARALNVPVTDLYEVVPDDDTNM